MEGGEFKKQYGPDYRKDLDLIFCNPDGSAPFERLKIPKP